MSSANGLNGHVSSTSPHANYDQDLADLLGQDGQDGEQEESFSYPGADTRPDFLRGGQADGDEIDGDSFLYPTGDGSLDDEDPNDDDDDDYATRMKSILGSSDDERDRDGEQDTSTLPDQTLDSIPDTSRLGKYKIRRVNGNHDGEDDIPPTPSSHSTTSLQSTRRPPEYPALSRLRSQVRAPSLRSQFASLLGSNGSGPGFHSHSPSSRSSSMSALRPAMIPFPYGSDITPSTAASVHAIDDPTPAQPPPTTHDIFRWSALRRASLFFNKRPATADVSLTATSGQRIPPNAGRQSALAVGNGLIAVGTSTGLTLVFEFSQQLRCLCEADSIAGRVTAIAFSADHTALVVGHAQGHINIFDLARPTSPSRTIPPITTSEVQSGRKEGHLQGSKILHVAFVGTRHTAIYSADVQGLAFYHSLGKILGVASNDTLRVLGRYTTTTVPVLAMDALPLGPIPHASDSNHFLALATDRKLVVVALKPNARTWYRKAVPVESVREGQKSKGKVNGLVEADGEDEDADHMDEEVGGQPPHAPPIPSPPPPPPTCCSWFPAYQATTPSSCTDADGFAPPRLAFAFGSHLYLLRLTTREVTTKDGPTPNTRTELQFTEERLPLPPGTQVHAIQWLSHEMLLLLTSTHVCLYDLRRRSLTEQEPIEPTLHGIVRQTWSQRSAPLATRTPGIISPSMQTHQGKVFFLTAQQVIVGHWLTWTDRILALVSTGDFLSAIELTTSYYTGSEPGSSVGLPEDVTQARSIVGSKLHELMSASARYAFSPDRLIDNTHVSADGRGVDRTHLFENLARLCAEACLALEDTTFLFGDLYDFYTDNGIEGIFVDQMEPFILDGRMRVLPIPVVQRLVRSCKVAENYALAEKIIWHVDPTCLDLDLVLSLCVEQRLYRALIYVYNAALGDYVAPLVELLEPLKRIIRGDEDEEEHLNTAHSTTDTHSAYTIFSYLSVTLSGHTYPSQDVLPAHTARKAKSTLYAFIFSGHCVVWPPGGGGRLVLTRDDESDEPTYPYLRLLLDFDAEAFLDALDVAFEDSWLDDEEEEDTTAVNGDINLPSRTTRQSIIDILLELTPTSTSNEDKTFTSIFIARNAPKYPQFIRLPSSVVHTLLLTLSTPSHPETREDRQLACESLLSAYRVELTDDVLELFDSAGFWRILQSAYRSRGKWGQLTAMILNDDLGMEVFGQLQSVLRKATTSRSSDLDLMVFEAVPALLKTSVESTVELVDTFYPSRHMEALEVLEDEEDQLAYLRVFFADDTQLDSRHLNSEERDTFVSLLARHDGAALVKQLESAQEGYFDLENVVQCGRAHDCPDALLWALDRLGRTSEAFDALDQVVAAKALELRRCGEEANTLTLDPSTTTATLRRATTQAVHLSTRRTPTLTPDEKWYRLLRSCVNLMHHVSDSPSSSSARSIVNTTLTSMVTSISSEQISFPTLFRRLVDNSSSSTQYYAEVRIVVEGLLEACKVRTDLLGLATQLGDRETAGAFRELVRRRKRGWRAAEPCSGTTRFATTAPPHRRSTSTATPLSRQPSRGMDFLSLSVDSAMATPRVDKGKGRDRSFDGDLVRLRGAEGGGGDELQEQQQQRQRHGEDYFGPGAAGEQEDKSTTALDPSEHFLPGFNGSRGVIAEEPVENGDGVDADYGDGVRDAHADDGYFYPRVPLTVRMGKVG